MFVSICVFYIKVMLKILNQKKSDVLSHNLHSNPSARSQIAHQHYLSSKHSKSTA